MMPYTYSSFSYLDDHFTLGQFFDIWNKKLTNDQILSRECE